MRVMVEGGIGLRGEVIPSWQPRSMPVQLVLLVRALLRVARSDRRAVVHVHLSQGGSFVREGLVLAVARRRSRAVVATVHGADFLPFAQARPRLARAVLRRAHVVTCLTAATRDAIAELVPGAALYLVDNPMPVDPAPTPAHETDELVLFGGEVGTRKGADVLSEAWPRVVARRPRARCLVVGPIGDWDMPPAERLEVRAPVSPETMRELLRASRVVALPSRSEAMPMILLEALGARRPFVSTAVGQIRALARGGNRLVEPGDAGALADALVHFLEDPDDARAVGEQGFARHVRQHTADVDADWRRLYQSALHTAHAHRRWWRDPAAERGASGETPVGAV
jgi:glycosyltransferase involved in cell wall biosynthesis